MISYDGLYRSYDEAVKRSGEEERERINRGSAVQDRPAIATFTLEVKSKKDQDAMDGFSRMRRCRMALDALDRAGWKRSFFQRKFHEAFIASCARAFFKLDPPGGFQRAFQKILDINGWDNLSQEILISTPRR